MADEDFARPDGDTPGEIAIALDQVCYVIVKARQFDVKEDFADEASGSNAADDGMTDVLEDTPDDPVEAELAAFIDALDVDERVELVALTWLGRGDGDVEDMPALRAEAARHTGRTAEYLLGIPLLADLLEEGLARFGLGCVGETADRL